MNEAINIVFSFFELFAVMLCVMSIFRLPICNNLIKISTIVLINTLISSYTFTHLPDIAILINLSCLVIMLTIFYKLPFFYSILITVIYFFMGGLIEYAGDLLVTNILNFPESSISVGGWGSRLSWFITGIVSYVLTWVLQRKKIGFLFIIKTFTIRQGLKAYNFALSAILIISIAVIQATSIQFNKFSIHGVILIILAILFLLGIFFAYKQNRKQLTEKYERLDRKMLSKKV